MSKKYLLLFCIGTILFSCKPKPHADYEQKILGDWKLTYYHYGQDESKNILLPPPPIDGPFIFSGYSFLPNNIFENKSGYFNYNLKPTYLGTKSIYKLDNDSAHIFNRTDNQWQGFKIIKLTQDSLLLKNREYSSLKYKRVHYIADTSFKYDQVVVSYYSSWGLGKSLLISHNGEATISELDTTGHRLFSQGNIPYKKLKEINKEFGIANIPKLKNEYWSGGYDGPETSITFIKDGKIIKSIHDYMEGAPPEFIWAYTHLRYADQSITKKLIYKNAFPYNFYNISFINGKNIAELTVSETFYLCTLLTQAKEATRHFSNNYDLRFYPHDLISQIQTDGQYYQVTYKNGSQKTYDIGFNFIDRNRDVLKFINQPAP